MRGKTSSLKGFCERHPALISKEDSETIYLMVTSPPSVDDIEQLTFTCQKKFYIDQVSEEEYNSYSPSFPARSFSKETKGVFTLTTIEHCHQILSDAIYQQASDIHIEPCAHRVRIRLRVDGVLHHYGELDPDEANAIESRFKLLAGVDIAENRRPQDGQLSFTLHDVVHSFRLATLPTRFGEKIVLRLLETFRGDLTLASLGMPAEQLSLMEKALSCPQGLIIVTGPTGSGKTTTLYSALTHLNCPERNLCSVEDPIELIIPGINQTQINLKAGVDFSVILRALLRQDPDIIMIGEIRDDQTADIAIKAAQTGHLVLSTLHTNSTIDTLSRLTQMGVVEYLIAASLKLIIAQRLVRRLCPHCRKLSPTPLSLKSPQFPLSHWLAVGCHHCVSGYSGRHAIYELLPIDESTQDAIIQSLPAPQFRLQRQQNGNPGHTLFDAGLNAVIEGITTYQELLRVIGEAYVAD